MNKFLSRKFAIALASLVSASYLAMESVIGAGDYKAVIIATVGAYIAGNVAQKATVKDAA
jgi:hypothetical protein